MGSYTYKCQKCGNDFQSSIGGGLFDVPPELCPSCDKKMKKEAMEFWKNNPHADNDLRLGGGPSIREVSKADFRPLSTGQNTTNPDLRTQLVFPQPKETKQLTKAQIEALNQFASGASFIVSSLKAYGEAYGAMQKFIQSVNVPDKALGVAGAAFGAKEIVDLALKDGYNKETAAMLGLSVGAAALIPAVSIYDTAAYGVNKVIYGQAVAYNTLVTHVMDLYDPSRTSKLLVDPNLAVQQYGARSSAQIIYAEMRTWDIYLKGVGY